MKQTFFKAIALSLCIGLMSGCAGGSSDENTQTKAPDVNNQNSTQAAGQKDETSSATSATESVTEAVNMDDYMVINLYTRKDISENWGFVVTRGEYGEYIEHKGLGQAGANDKTYTIEKNEDGSVVFYVDESKVTVLTNGVVSVYTPGHGRYVVKKSDQPGAEYMVTFEEYQYTVDTKYRYYNIRYYDADFRLVERKRWNYADRNDASKVYTWTKYTYDKGKLMKEENLYVKGKKVTATEEYNYCSNGHRINPRKDLTVSGKNVNCEIDYECHCEYDDAGRVIKEEHTYAKVIRLDKNTEVPLKNQGTVGESFRYTYNADGTVHTFIHNDDNTTTYEYNANGTLKSALHQDEEMPQYIYDENGYAVRENLGDNAYVTYSPIRMKKNEMLMAAYRLVFLSNQVGPRVNDDLEKN